MWHRREERGSVVVEFALVLPIIVLLLFGMIEFGRGYNAKVQLTSAVREGARAVALNTDVNSDGVVDTDDVSQATTGGAPGLEAGDIAVNVVTACGTNPPPGSNAQVEATYPFHYDIPMFRSATLTLSVKGVMRCGG